MGQINYILDSNKIHLLDRDILFVIGYPCSGKDFFADQYKSTRVIFNVSDVVKRLVNSVKTSTLNDTVLLDNQIAEELRKDILHQLGREKKVIITGLRQPSILNILLKDPILRLEQNEYTFIHLNTSLTVCEERYKNRARITDDITFEQLIKKNNDLGLDKLIDLIKTHPTNYLLINQN